MAQSLPPSTRTKAEGFHRTYGIPALLHVELGEWLTTGAAVTVLIVAWSLPYSYTVLISIALCVAYHHVQSEKPRLKYSADLADLVSCCTRLSSEYSPTPWAISGHIQSAMFAFWPQADTKARSHSVRFKQETLTLQDGGQVALDWSIVGEGDANMDPGRQPDAPILLMLPGIVGQNGNAYFVRLAQYIRSHTGGRFRVVVKSWRGIGCALSPKQPRPEAWDTHAVSDTLEAAEHLRRQYPAAPMFLVGFSHGGNIVVGTLAHERASSLFTGGVAISAPFDLQRTMNFLESDTWAPYAFINTKTMLYCYRESKSADLMSATSQAAAAGFGVLDRLLTFRNLLLPSLVRRAYGSAWHKHITLPYIGQTSVQHYYGSIAKMVEESLSRVHVPLLCFLSEDDPVTPPSTFSHLVGRMEPVGMKAVLDDGVQLAHSTVVCLTKRGGHCGWFYGLAGKSWLDEAMVEFLQVCLRQRRSGRH